MNVHPDVKTWTSGSMHTLLNKNLSTMLKSEIPIQSKKWINLKTCKNLP